jgi:hypothetical protein
MNVHRWLARDERGREIRATEDFDSRAAAEEWLGREWTSLVDEGAESVILLDEGGDVVYEMSLEADSGE